MAHRFEIYRDKAGEYRVRFKYNHEVMWSSEGYSSKASALSLIQSIKKNGPSAQVEDSDPDALDVLHQIRNVPIPAADRIVTPDHNSKEFRDFKSAHSKISDKFRASNDLQEFSTEELDFAKNELAEIGQEAERPSFRGEHLWLKAKSTLLWIAEKAADGVVKALAVGLLVAIASLIGIPLPI
jgi:uncharacterized protein YegP (UPF0339 family)